VIEHPKILTRPRHARSAAGVPSGLRPGPLAGDQVPRHWRRRRFVASFTDREDEDPAELPDELHALTTAPPARATPAATLAHACNRCLPATRHHDQATARPIGCRCAVSPSPWPACRRSPSRCCSTLAPSSLRGQFHRSRGRRPAATAGDRAPATARTRPRHARSAAGAPSRRRPGPLAGDRLPGTARHWRRRRFEASFTDREDGRPGRTAGDRAPPQHGPRHGTPDRLPVRRLAVALARLPAIAFPVLLDAGAVVASWPASTIERTKTRKHCR
jgi:hypothetical protein